MMENFEESVKCYQQALEINHKSPECHFNLASAYNDLGQSEKAVEHFKHCVTLDEANLDAFLMMANNLESVQGREIEAKTVYD